MTVDAFVFASTSGCSVRLIGAIDDGCVNVEIGSSSPCVLIGASTFAAGCDASLPCVGSNDSRSIYAALSCRDICTVGKFGVSGLGWGPVTNGASISDGCPDGALSLSPNVGNACSEVAGTAAACGTVMGVAASDDCL